jgi:peptidoglycan/xylan/chitin deacetylase (PgdA/CDA1 family)
VERACIEVASIHRVGEPQAHDIGVYSDTTISAEHLERYLETRRDWRPALYDDLCAAADGAPGEGRAFILSCDDGYRSAMTELLPLLEKRGISCLLFVTTGFISGDLEPYEMQLADFLAGRGQESSYERIRLELKPASPAARRRSLAELFDASGGEPPAPRAEEFLSWEELRELSRHPLVTVGAHTVNHPLLTALPWVQAFKELRHAKREIQSRLGRPVEAVAYPYGGHSLRVRTLARLAGYRYGFTTRAARISAGPGLNRLALPRIDLREMTDGQP